MMIRKDSNKDSTIRDILNKDFKLQVKKKSTLNPLRYTKEEFFNDKVTPEKRSIAGN